MNTSSSPPDRPDHQRDPVLLVAPDPAWPQAFQEACSSITGALGHVVDGGVLEGLEHMGSTSVPGLVAKPTIDIMGRIYTYPPTAEMVAALAAIGFVAHGEFGLPGRSYFTKGPHEIHLHLVSFESEHWERHLVFRDYLRANAAARERYAYCKTELAEKFRDDRPAYQAGKTEVISSLEQEAKSWHLETTGFGPIKRLAEALKGLPDDGSWAVAGGWALDLHMGAPSRYHDDVDVEIDHERRVELPRLLQDKGWRLDKVVGASSYVPWSPGDSLNAGNHQVHARKAGELVDLQFAPRTRSDWVYRRDERVTLPLARAIKRARGPEGLKIPYLAPEAVLLFKSRSSSTGAGESGPRLKDGGDFARLLPTLDAEARAWLVDALRTVHGEHPWLKDLTANG